MKYILIFLLLPTFATAQLDKAVDEKIKTFAGTLDSSVVVSVTNTGAFYIDTIKVPLGETQGFIIRLSGNQGGKVINALQYIFITNNNGQYLVEASSIKSLVGFTWSAMTMGNYAVVRVQGNTIKTKWNYKRLSL